jgi:hypothetical protein
LFDAYGTYNEGFILMGLMIAFSGLMLYPVPCMQRRLQVTDKALSIINLIQILEIS